MELQIGDVVQVEPSLLGTSLAVMLGDKARRLVGRKGVIVDTFPFSVRPFLVHLVVEEGPVYVRLRGEELSLTYSVAAALSLETFAIERMKRLSPA